MSISPQKKIILLVTGYWLLVTLAGCAAISEGVKGVTGVSTKVLEDERKNAIVKSLNYDYFSCFTKTSDILKRINTYIYKQDIKKQMIAIYVSSEDTTPVGLFFKEVDASHTQLEISSPSASAKELIAKQVFLALEESINTEQKK
jgi:hypothetical protein